jgi:hypothetical protein
VINLLQVVEMVRDGLPQAPIARQPSRSSRSSSAFS